MNVDIYSYDDYRALIKALVKSEKQSWGLWTRLAKAAGCQTTYLSQAMKGSVQLTCDHIYGISRFWDLSEFETDFLILLLEYERAATKELKSYFKNRITLIRNERSNLAKRLEKPRLPEEKEHLYYSAWFYAALHVIVSIPEYRTPQAIAKRLGLSAEQVESALEELALHGIVAKEGRHWKLGTRDIHVPENSLMVSMHHNNWRQKAVTDSALRNKDSIHYTGIYSMSRADIAHLREKILDLIEHSRKILGPSKEEDIVCFTCDLFTL